MSQTDFNTANASGLLFRQDLNNHLAAIVSNFSGNTAPLTTTAFMWWVDTSGAYPILRQRNAADSAWIEIGRIDVANFGLLPLTGGTITGPLLFSNTDYMTIPKGTTAQRPLTPVEPSIRYNTDLVTVECYKAGAWSDIGGGGYNLTATQAISSGGTITTSTSDKMQARKVQGASAPQVASTTPFGVSGGWKDGAVISLIGADDINTLSITPTDVNYGILPGVGGGASDCELKKGFIVEYIWDATLIRFYEKTRNF